jgi:hypothetical protein
MSLSCSNSDVMAGGTNQPAGEMTAMAEMAGHMRHKDVEIVGEVGGSRP